jgi:hypothetical protein
LIGFYVWARHLIPNEIAQKLSVVLLLLLNVWLRFHFNPQAFGLILLPMLLISFMKEGRTWSAVSVILTIALVLFHPISPAFVLLLLGVEFVILRILGRKPNSRRLLLLFFSMDRMVKFLRLHIFPTVDCWQNNK